MPATTRRCASRDNGVFSAKYTDGETGLIYFGYRYYQPPTGQWLNRDPIEEAGGGNLYHYGFNAPVILIDPLGLASIGTIVGHVKIVALDKTYPSTQTTDFSSSTCRWEVFGKLAINGSNYGAAIKVYPTGESGVLDDSGVTTIDASGAPDETILVTVIRPKRAVRGAITPLFSYNTVVTFNWTIFDQLGGTWPAGYRVTETLNPFRSTGVFLSWLSGTRTHFSTTIAGGTIGDEYGAWFYTTGYVDLDQHLIMGNWDAAIVVRLQSSGTLVGGNVGYFR